MSRVIIAAVAVWLLTAAPLAVSQGSQSPLPPTLESYLRQLVKLTNAERRRLLAGAAITKLLPGDDSKEVGVFGAIWIDADPHRYVEAVSDIEKFERGGGFRMTKRISAPPTPEDFAQLHLPEADVEDLRRCRVGGCEVKLGEDAIQRLHAEVNWDAPDHRAQVQAFIRRLAFAYVNGYLEGGNDRLATYRDAARPISVAAEFRALIDRMPELKTQMPGVQNYLLEYPKVTLPGSTSFLYWQETHFGLKPTIRISHLTITEQAQQTVVMSKMLYASHYVWAALELRTLLPEQSRGRGFWFITVSRSRSDGLSGFTGVFVRRRVRSEVQQRTSAVLQTTKQMLEKVR